MKLFYRFLLFSMMLPAVLHAQQNTDTTTPGIPASFTLEQCIQYAVAHSVTVTNSTLDEEIANAKVKETRGIGLPQINGSLSLQHNQQLQRFFGYYSTAQGFGGVDPDTGKPLIDVPGVSQTDVVALKSPFQLKSNGTASVSVSQIIFNGSYLVGLKAANTYRQLAVRTTNQRIEQTVQQVIKAYYAVLISNDRMQLFDNNIARVDSLLRNTKAMNENGFAESIDVSRIQVSLNNLKSERDNYYNLRELSVQILKFQMNYPMDRDMTLEGNIGSIQIDENLLDSYSADWDYAKRTDYALLETNKRLQELDLKNKYASSMPTLSFNGTLGYSTQSPNVAGLFKTNTSIPAGYDYGGMLGPDKWYQYSFIGVNLNVPIFTGLQHVYQQQQSKLALQKIESNFVQLKSSIDLEVKQSAINYLNAVTSLKSQDANRGLAENVARITKIKYEQGVGSNIEVIDAENSLKQSQVNYYNALYDALVAKVDLDKAYGKLNPQNNPSIITSK